MHACSLHHDNHSPWSPLNCQKTGSAPEPKTFKGRHAPAINRLNLSACTPTSSQTAVRLNTTSPCRLSWTLAAQSLPYLQALRRRTRFWTRLVVESELLDCESRTAAGSKHTGLQCTTIIPAKTLLCRSKCTTSISIQPNLMLYTYETAAICAFVSSMLGRILALKRTPFASTMALFLITSETST
jgi:hypothetical protein